MTASELRNSIDNLVTDYIQRAGKDDVVLPTVVDDLVVFSHFFNKKVNIGRGFLGFMSSSANADRHRFLEMTGLYFGETIRKKYGGDWTIDANGHPVLRLAGTTAYIDFSDYYPIWIKADVDFSQLEKVMVDLITRYSFIDEKVLKNLLLRSISMAYFAGEQFGSPKPFSPFVAYTTIDSTLHITFLMEPGTSDQEKQSHVREIVNLLTKNSSGGSSSKTILGSQHTPIDLGKVEIDIIIDAAQTGENSNNTIKGISSRLRLDSNIEFIFECYEGLRASEDSPVGMFPVLAAYRPTSTRMWLNYYYTEINRRIEFRDIEAPEVTKIEE